MRLSKRFWKCNCLIENIHDKKSETLCPHCGATESQKSRRITVLECILGDYYPQIVKIAYFCSAIHDDGIFTHMDKRDLKQAVQEGVLEVSYDDSFNPPKIIYLPNSQDLCEIGITHHKP